MNLVEHYILEIISEKRIILNNKEFILTKNKNIRKKRKMKLYSSNCLFEFIKYKIRNPKIKLLYVPSFLNEVRCFHIMWSDGKNEYDFNYNGYLPFYKWIWHKGYIRKLNKGTYSKYMCHKIQSKYGE